MLSIEDNIIIELPVLSTKYITIVELPTEDNTITAVLSSEDITIIELPVLSTEDNTIVELPVLSNWRYHHSWTTCATLSTEDITKTELPVPSTDDNFYSESTPGIYWRYFSPSFVEEHVFFFVLFLLYYKRGEEHGISIIYTWITILTYWKT